MEPDGESLRKKMIGKPYSGKLNVRFDEGELEIAHSRLRQLSALPKSVVICSLILVLIFAPAFDVHGSLPQKRVLLLYSEDKAHPAHELTDRGIRAVFQSNKLFDVQLYSEYLDVSRFSGPGQTRAVADYLGRKYDGLKIDTIITIYPAALAVLLGEASAGFPGVPIVACEIVRATAENLESSPSRRFTTGVIMGDNIAGVLDSAFRMRPGTKRVALVAGTTPNDADGELLFRNGLKPYAGKIELIDLTKLPMQEILARVGSLPMDTIVLYSTIFRDGAGESFVPREALTLISAAANGPVFSLYDTLMGYGIVGGRLVSLERQGREAAELALRIMGGESPASIPFGGEQAYVALYDWRELNRWGMNESALPADAIMLNKPVSAWERYKLYIIGTLAFCLLETVLIIFLIVQRRRKNVAEESLRQKTEELDQFFNVSLDLLCIANTEGYFQRLNPAWERILGYTREELMAKRFLDFVHPDDLDRTQEAVFTLASQQKVNLFRNRYRCKDGTYRWLEWSSAPIGKLIYAAARDVTERRQMEETIKKDAEEWQTTFDSIQDLVMILDQEFKIVRVNALVLSFFKLPLERVLGTHCFTLMHGTDKPPEICPFTTVMKTKKHEETEFYDKRRDAWFQVSVDPIFDDKGETINIAHVVKDITGRKRAEAEVARIRIELLHVERSSRMGELTASLAHELNQPLAAILSSAQAALRFLQSATPDLNLFRKVLQNIIQDDKRAADVITSLRSMMRREEREREPFNINTVLNDVLNLFHSEATVRNVTIERDFDRSVPPVLGDKIQLQQVVLNLVMNAAEAMSESPHEHEKRKIILRTQATGHGIQVAVRDFGPGIDPAKLDDIWQPFFTTKSTGLGMGLSVSRSIIQAHGGRISAENHPDGGAMFTFEIPVISKQ